MLSVSNFQIILFSGWWATIVGRVTLDVWSSLWRGIFLGLLGNGEMTSHFTGVLWIYDEGLWPALEPPSLEVLNEATQRKLIIMNTTLVVGVSCLFTSALVNVLDGNQQVVACCWKQYYYDDGRCSGSQITRYPKCCYTLTANTMNFTTLDNLGRTTTGTEEGRRCSRRSWNPVNLKIATDDHVQASKFLDASNLGEMPRLSRHSVYSSIAHWGLCSLWGCLYCTEFPMQCWAMLLTAQISSTVIILCHKGVAQSVIAIHTML